MDLAPGITLHDLRQALHKAEPGAVLMEPRILRRVIRLDRRLPGLGLSVPHRKSYTIERDRLLAFVERSELELPPEVDLPRTVILLSKPEDDEALDEVGAEAAWRRYWRLLFHTRVHVELHRAAGKEAAAEWAAARREQIGEVAFAEIRAVLLKDDFLFPAPTDLETYIEFAAVYLELRYFAEHELPLYFPAVRDWEAIDRLVSNDVDHARLWRQTALGQAAACGGEHESEADLEELLAPVDVFDPASYSPAMRRRFQTRAERMAAVGNRIKAAIWWTRAARAAPSPEAQEALAAARRELTQFVARLQQALELSDEEARQWLSALAPLLAPAAQGYWSNEARLLYDLQKVCVEHERGVYKLDLIEWIRTWGRRPIRRSLPLLREVLITRHLRTANRRVAAARVGALDRQRLATLLAAAVHGAEHRSRDRIRPLLVEVLDEVGLVPQNVPERAARRKLVEELLDRVVEHGYLNMGHLRDALSKNDLKLPDVTSVWELIRGNQLLQADRRLDSVLDGVYRRGAVYLRWPQTLSSLAFGTNCGRWVTQYVALPFGGAYLLLEFLRHLAAPLTGRGKGGHAAASYEELAQAPFQPEWSFYAAVLCLGAWLALLIHRPEFRALNLAVLERVWRMGRQVLVELPGDILRSEWVQRILHSQTFAAVQNYLLRPATVTLLLLAPWAAAGRPWSGRLALEMFLAAALFLNSPVGRYAAEVTIDFFVRAWHELRMRVFAAAYQWVMDLFHGLLVALERVVYTVDEWLRFRAGDSRWSQAVKLVGGAAWFFVAYVIVFVFTLLVEPQINPIKHFPVVTVSHKLILPTGPVFVAQLAPYIGGARANTLVWTTIWLIPGVFGFLVWELKENWRLYAANRPPRLRPVPIGHHGETMLRLLRPGFHSGTLPKAFASLRRAARKAERTGDGKPINRKWAAVQRVEEAVRRFVERDLLGLLEEAQFLPEATLAVGEIRAATNRIDVELCRHDQPAPSAWIAWEEQGGVLRAGVAQAGWLDALGLHERQTFAAALAGLFQRAGVDEPADDAASSLASPIAWEEWVALWSPHAAPSPARPLPAPLTSRAG